MSAKPAADLPPNVCNSFVLDSEIAEVLAALADAPAQSPVRLLLPYPAAILAAPAERTVREGRHDCHDRGTTLYRTRDAALRPRCRRNGRHLPPRPASRMPVTTPSANADPIAHSCISVTAVPPLSDRLCPGPERPSSRPARSSRYWSPGRRPARLPDRRRGQLRHRLRMHRPTTAPDGGEKGKTTARTVVAAMTGCFARHLHAQRAVASDGNRAGPRHDRVAHERL